LVRAKTNISDDIGGFGYSLEVLNIHSGITTTRVVWGEQLEGTARSILADFEEVDSDSRSPKLSQAKAYLLEALKNGPVLSKELLEQALEAQGITPDTMRRAKDDLSISHRKLGMNQGWVWELPITVNARQWYQ
jgi:putative DNA primase/helicase